MVGNKTCVICGGQAEAIHHVDGDRDNNTAKNLVPVCTSCHNQVHYGSTEQTLPWFAKLNEAARRRTLPTVGVDSLSGSGKNAFEMDEALKAADNAARKALARKHSRPTGEKYWIGGIHVNSTFVRRFRSETVSHKAAENRLEHRLTPAELEIQGQNCALKLPVVDERASETTRARAAYKAYLDTINQKQGLRGHGGRLESSTR